MLLARPGVLDHQPHHELNRTLVHEGRPALHPSLGQVVLARAAVLDLCWVSWCRPVCDRPRGHRGSETADVGWLRGVVDNRPADVGCRRAAPRCRLESLLLKKGAKNVCLASEF